MSWTKAHVSVSQIVPIKINVDDGRKRSSTPCGLKLLWTKTFVYALAFLRSLRQFQLYWTFAWAFACSVQFISSGQCNLRDKDSWVVLGSPPSTMAICVTGTTLWFATATMRLPRATHAARSLVVNSVTIGEWVAVNFLQCVSRTMYCTVIHSRSFYRHNFVAGRFTHTAFGSLQYRFCLMALHPIIIGDQRCWKVTCRVQ